MLVSSRTRSLIALAAAAALLLLLSTTTFAQPPNPAAPLINPSDASVRSASVYVGGLTGLRGIVVDTADNLYYSEGYSGEVTQVTPAQATSVFATGLAGMSDLALDNNDVLAVLVGDVSKVPASNTIVPFASGLPASSQRIAFDSGGNMYVVGAYDAIAKFDSAGTLITSTLSSGFGSIAGLVVDPISGDLLVSQPDGHIWRVDSITGDASLYLNIGQYTDSGLALSPSGDLYYGDSMNGRVLKIEAGTKFVTSCVSGVGYVRDLALDSLGRLYIADDYTTVYRADACDPPAHGAVSGKVTTTDGVTPVPDATVCVGPYDESFYWTCLGVQPDGTYVIPLLDPYSYRVEARAPNRENELYFDTPFYNQALPVLVTSGSTTPNIDFTLGAGGSIQGTITLTDAGSVSNGWVCVDEYDTGNHIRCRTGDVIDFGALTYSFDHLPSGTFRVRMWMQGYGQKYWDDTFLYDEADPVTVLAPTPTTGINFTFDPGGSISGTVYELDGTTPVLNAEVCLESMDNGFGFGCQWVNPADGTYTFDGVQSGNYRVDARADGLEQEYWEETPYWDLTTPVVVTAPDPVTGIDFTLGPAGAISGTISLNDAGDLALANPSVCINEYVTNYHIRCHGSDIINIATGAYVFDNLPAGTYRVSAYAFPYLDETYQERRYYHEGDPVVVTVPDITPNIDFTLDPAGTISGTVRDAVTNDPLGGIPVDLDNGGYGTCTNPNGTYTIERVPLDEPHTVQAGGPGWDTCPGDNHTREWWQEESDRNNADPITLTYGANQFETGIDFTLDVGGSFSGRVTEADGITPVTDAQVCAHVHPFGEGVGCFNVNPDGTYTFDALPAGLYNAEVRASGFATEMYDSVTYYGDHGLATPIPVTIGVNTPNINFTLEPGGSISGTIFASDGVTPLPSVPFGVFWGGFNNCADGSGTYTISGLPLNVPITLYAGGPAESWMQGCDGGFIREWWQEKQYDYQADPITLTLGVDQNVTGKNFTLDVGGSFSGRVTEEDGTTPIPNAQVCAQIHPFGANSGCVNADNQGYYTFSGLGTASYAVNARADGFAQELFNNVPWYGDRSLATPVNVTAGADTPNIHFALGPAGTISGIVYDEDGVTPLGGIPIDLEFGGFGNCTNPDGTYTIYNVPLGLPVVIRAGGQGWPGCPGDFHLREYWQEAENFDQADPITLGPGPNQHLGGIDFTLSLGGAISGTVTEADGTTPIYQANICLGSINTPSWYGCQQTNPDGTYLFGGLPDGQYRVEATKDGYAAELWENKYIYGNFANPTPVDVSAGATTPDINFTLDPGGTISGTVRAADGVTFLPLIPVGTDGLWFDDCSSNSDGTYTIRGLPLNVPIYMSAGGPRRWLGFCDDSYLMEWWQEEADFANADPITLTPGGGEHATGIDFTLDLGGSISGTIYEADGVTPIASTAWVCVAEYPFGQGMGCLDANTVVNGVYTFSGLPTGNYRVEAYAENHVGELYDDIPVYLDWGLATPVAVTAGSTTANIDFALEPGGNITGVVYAADGITPLANVPVDLEQGGFGRCTGPDGTYYIDGVPVGTPLLVRAGGNGWDGCPGGSHLHEWWEEADTVGDADPITLTLAGEVAGDINFTLDPAGSISGKVTEPDGTTPITDSSWAVWVCLTDHTTEEGIGCQQANANGTYAFGGLPTASYRVAVYAENRVFEIYDNVPQYMGIAGITPVGVTAGADTPNINFALDPGGTITGTVFDAGGTSRLTDIAIRIDIGGWSVCSRTPDGTYLFDGLPLGVPIAISAGGLEDAGCGDTQHLREWWQESSDEAGADPITLTAGAGQNVTAKDFTLEVAPRITGKLTAADGVTVLPNSQVCINDYATDAGMGCVPVAGDGTYVSMPLEPGSYRVFGRADGHITEMWDNIPITSDPALATPVVLTAGNDATDIDFALDPAGTISGHVYATDGVTPLGNIPVDIEGGGFGRCTEPDGSYQITDLPLGTYTVHAGGVGWPECPGDLHLPEWWEESSTAGTADPITLAVGPTQNASGIDFTLALGGTLSGTMTETDGTTPLAGDVCVETFAGAVEVGCYGVDPGTGAYTTAALPAGSYRVTGHALDHISQFYDGLNHPADPAAATPVVVTAGADQPGIDFALDLAGSISGTVFAADGTTPLGSIPVDLEGGGYGRCTEPDGTYTIDGLPLGVGHIVHAGGAGWPECPGGTHLPEWWQEAAALVDADPITLTAGAEQHQTGKNFTLDPAGSISGTVRDAVSNDPLGGIPVDVEGGGYGTCTLPDGSYILRDLPVGVGIIIHAGGPGWPECPGDSHLIEWWQEADTLGDADPITLTLGAGQNVTGKDFTLSEALAAPGGLTATVITNNQIDLSWNDNSIDETAFHIERSPDGAAWAEIDTVAADVESYSDTTTFCGSTYHYRVRAFRAGDGLFSSYSAPAIATTDVCPSGIELLTPPNGDVTRNRTPAFTWTDTDGTATKFRIQIATDDAFAAVIVDEQPTLPSFTPASNLPKDTQFWWRVAAKDAGGWRAWSYVWTFTVDRTAPAIPTLLSPANGLTINALQDFCWNAATDAVSYEIEVSSDPAFGSFAATATETDLCFTSPALDDGMWFWHVRAYDLAGNKSDWSSTWAVQVDIVPAVSPTLLLPADLTVTRERQPEFGWTAVTDAQKYRIEIASDAGFVSIVQTADTTGTAFTPADKLAEGTYFWHVSAKAPDGLWSAFSSAWSFTIDRTPPDVPALLSPANGLTITALQDFCWNAATGAATYEIELSDDPTFTNFPATAVQPALCYMSPALDDGMWFWRVRAYDAVGNKSDWSSTWAVQVDLVPALPPVLLSPDDAYVTRDKTPDFAWLPAPDAKKYRIEVAQDFAFVSIVISDKTKVELYAAPEKLSAGTYYWHVQTQGSDGLWSAFSPTWSFTIDRTAPAAPILISPAHKEVVMTLTPTFDWEDNLEADFDEYIIELDNNKDFSSPILDEEVDVSTYTPAAALPGSKVFWRVRAVDEVGNKSDWSETRKLEMTVLKSVPGFRGW
ncbi:MAG: carboxypeptidase regulatory-like domain-containing protein [Chloroflexi bacterium]|nr:carboxypeptidase regulatory-like domain-containing protein [Chloroflexota bacterium]